MQNGGASCLGNETKLGTELPKWHEAEVGAPGRRKSTRPSPEVGIPAFPGDRWPSANEAKIRGYKT
eukprot:9922935-Karenia_brevis.AAC.1